jgi:hypothetical protein
MDFVVTLNMYRILDGSTPSPCRVSRLHGGPIAADPNPVHAPGVKGITSQMAGPYTDFQRFESNLFHFAALAP